MFSVAAPVQITHEWVATRDFLCPVCRKTRCKTWEYSDGTSKTHCWKRGGWFHSEDGFVAHRSPPESLKGATREQTNPFVPTSDDLLAQLKAICWPSLAERLEKCFGCSASSFERLGTYGTSGIFHDPERDSSGAVVGECHSEFSIDGEKIERGGRWFSGKRGLSYDPAIELAPGQPLLIVEGATDVAASVDMGLVAVGRANNTFTRWLPELVRRLEAQFVELHGRAWGTQTGEDIIVMGENDADDDGWPGMDGLRKVFTTLAKTFPPKQSSDVAGLRAALPPVGFKDIRHCLNERTDALPAAVGRELLEQLTWISADELGCAAPPRVMQRDAPKAPKPVAPDPVRPQAVDDDDEPTRCPRAATASLASKETGNLRLMRLSCKTWGCEHCRRRILIPKWTDHVTQKLKAGETYHRIVITEREWKTVRRQISRRFGQYVRIPMPSGLSIAGIRCGTITWVVYTTAAVPGANELSGRDAQRQAQSEVRGCLKKPSTSRGWSLPEPAESEYTRLEKGVPFDRRAASQVAREFGWKDREWKRSRYGIEAAIDFDAGVDITLGLAWEAHERYIELARLNQIARRPNCSMGVGGEQSDWDTNRSAEPRLIQPQRSQRRLKLQV